VGGRSPQLKPIGRRPRLYTEKRRSQSTLPIFRVKEFDINFELVYSGEKLIRERISQAHRKKRLNRVKSLREGVTQRFAFPPLRKGRNSYLSNIRYHDVTEFIINGKGRGVASVKKGQEKHASYNRSEMVSSSLHLPTGPSSLKRRVRGSQNDRETKEKGAGAV